jgi:putative transposase
MAHLAHKIKMCTTPEQAHFFRRAAGVARFTYNWALGECRRAYQETGKQPSMGTLKKQFNAIKGKEFPWIYESPKDANQQAFADLGSAWSKFFSGLKAGKKPVYHKKQQKELLAAGVKHSEMTFVPKFKSKRSGEASFYLSNDKFKVADRKAQIPLLGWVDLAEPLRFKGKICYGTVTRDGDDWFLVVTVAVPRQQFRRQRSNNGVIGVDLGIKTTAVFSDGTVAVGPKPLKGAARRLTIRQRRVNRKQQHRINNLKFKKEVTEEQKQQQRLAALRATSKNEVKASIAVRKIHGRVKNIRRDFQHKLTTQLCRENQTVVIEDLNVAGMLKNHKLARSLSDIGMGEIRRQLVYKAKRYRTRLVVANRFFPSSQLCSACGEQNPVVKDLKIREWTCPSCGVIHDRDVNAAKNLRSLVSEQLYIPSGNSEIYARQRQQQNTARNRATGGSGQESTQKSGRRVKTARPRRAKSLSQP